MLGDATPCIKFASFFQSPLLEDEDGVRVAVEVHTQATLMIRTTKLCGDCPLRAQCLTNAVISYDVTSFAVGTTEPQHREVRAHLEVIVESRDLDSFAGVSSGHNFDHAGVHRLRQVNPVQPLSAIAAHVGCFVSMVRHHLKRAENQDGVVEPVSQENKSGKREVIKAAAEALSPASSAA